MSDSTAWRYWIFWLVAGWVLAWPALWNGYPLFFYDSLDYIRSGFSLAPEIYRSLPYSLFLAVPQQAGTLWAVVALQAGIGSYVLVELFRAYSPSQSSAAFLSLLLLVAITTGLPWFASQIMPDFFTGIMVACLALLLLAPLNESSRPKPFNHPLLLGEGWDDGSLRINPFRPDQMRMLALSLIALVAIPAHASHLPTALALALMGLFCAWRGARVNRRRALWVLGLVLGAALITPASHYFATGSAYLSHNASIMAMARLIRDGEAQRYLAETCPGSGLQICGYLDQLPTPGPSAANDFLWKRGSAFEQMGGWAEWQAIGQEAKQVVMGSWLAHPGSNLVSALGTWLEQLGRFGLGTGLAQDIWHVSPMKDVVSGYFPDEHEQLLGSRQFTENLRLLELSALQQAFIGLATLGALLLSWRKRAHGSLASVFFALVLLAALVNAAVTGVVSNPDDRYQARLVWLMVPACLFLWQRYLLSWSALMTMRSQWKPRVASR